MGSGCYLGVPRMTQSIEMLRVSRYRKLALSSQGLTRARPFGSASEAVLRAIEHLGYIQIDTISVVERAHHHVLWSRIPDYQADDLDRLIQSKAVFEYWFHAAAYLPMKDYRFARPRMEAVKSGGKHWFDNTSRKLMKEIYRRIEVEGPLMARDFKDPTTRKGGWWEWKPAKQALEQLFIEGDLMVVGREGFQKRYDIAERALPPQVNTESPTLHEYAQHLIELTLRAHGFAHKRSFTYLRKGMDLRDEVNQCLQSAVDEGRLLMEVLPDGDAVYIKPEALEINPSLDKKVRLLSPFDNCVIQRQRCRSVFDFEFQIECYVPAPKRQYGYFCLPILYKDKFLGRVDSKADRKKKILNVLSLNLETNTTAGDKTHSGGRKINIDDAFLSQLAGTLRRFMVFNHCETLALGKVRPAKFKKPLRSMLEHCCCK